MKPWRKDIGPGNLFLNLVVNYLNEYSTQDTPTAPFRDSVGTLDQGGQFEYRIFANLTYSAGDWSVGTRLRHLPSADDQSAVQNPATGIIGVDSYSLVDVFGSYRINDQLNLRAGIDNLFDPDPEVVGENPGFTNAISTTNAGFYDILGRRYWLGINFGF